MAGTQEITLLHFNDVYHIANASRVARFASIFADPSLVLGEARNPAHELRIFSGDAFSPSLEASVLRGEHMTALLDALNIDVACYGNHDFDFGEARLTHLSRQTSFPWTLANAVRKRASGASDRFLALAHEYVVKEVAGHRIGFFGLAGTDWPSNCRHLPDCEIHDPVSTAQRLARHLRRNEKCDLVIAITHMRLAEDIATSKATLTGEERVDLFLGGHDHEVVRRSSTDDEIDPNVVEQGVPASDAPVTDFEGDVRIVKSGTDWKGLSVLRLEVSKCPNAGSSIVSAKLKQFHDLDRIPNKGEVPRCSRMLQIIADCQSRIERLVQQPLLLTDVPLEGRSRVVRSREANLGNMLADAVRAYYNTEIAFVNSGAIRCDKIIKAEKGAPLRVRDVIDISPFDNALVVKRVSGSALSEAFENSVSDAHMDGRFLQLSGVHMTADWSHREGSRVTSMTYLPTDGPSEPIDPDRMYSVAMVDFIALGFDGYSCFREAETLVEAEGAMTDTNLLLQVFGGALSKQEADITDADFDDDTAGGISRAKSAVIHRWHEVSKLPVIKPSIEGRIQFESRPNL
ncbi:hypothetical protein HIM_02895 [Hirsutella minnesotensis 3608]|nr:hypothetical protein HIM_02895 [Hirsutella minnesotensis 3608]